MLVIAANALSDIKIKLQNKQSKMKTINITLLGVYVVLFTCDKNLENGKPPSLATANIILEVTVRLLNPAKKRFIINNTLSPSIAELLFPNAI
jgi:hypothetical protein